MGDTKDSFGTGGGQYVLVAAFEGYDTLVCSGPVPTSWPVEWTSLVNATAEVGTITKSAGAADWDAGGVSTRSIYAGKVAITVATTSDRYMTGLSNGNSGVGFADIDFAAYVFGSSLFVYEGGASKSGPHTIAAGDVVEVRTDGATVTYWCNNVLVYTSATAPTLPLLVDCSIYGVDDSFAATLYQGVGSAALTAWAATDWSTVIAGLRIAGTLEQEIDPWSTELNPMELTLLVAPDSSDTFGIACNQGGAGTESYLETALDCDDTSVIVTDGDQFDAPAGTVYIGTERIDYTGNAANTLTGCTRGRYFPASRDSETTYQFGRAHPLPSAAADVAQKPIVTSAPRVWIGKHVAVHLHKVNSGVLDTVVESQRIFYGLIEAIEDAEDGTTVVRCVSIEEQLNRTVLLNDQYSGVVADGIVLGGATPFDLRLSAMASGVYTYYNATQYSLSAGTYTAEEIAEELTTWLNADATVNAAADFIVSITSDGRFSIVALTVTSGPTPLGEIRIRASKYLLSCLGWSEFAGDDAGFAYKEDAATEFLSPDPVVRGIGFAGYDGTGITVAEVTGTWFDNESTLPDSVRGNTVAGENWGVVQVGNGLFVARYASATSLDALYALPDQTEYMYGQPYVFAVRADGDPPIPVKQIVMIEGSFADVIGKLFMSTGTTDYNNATYDDWPAQLGAAIPYGLLSTDFITSVTALSESTEVGSVTLVLDRPTYLWDAISADLLMRVAWLVWKDGGLIFGTAVTPHSSVATHTWIEASKQGTDPSDRLRTVATTTSEPLRNVLKIKYNRRALTDDTYGSTLEVRFTRSIQEYGERVQTVEARNSYGDDGSESVEALAADIVTKVMPLYGVPLKKMRRPLSLEYYEGVAPGDVALVTDPHMRDPATGARSVTSKPSLIVSHLRKFTGTPLGEAEVLYVDLDRAAIYSPSCEVASYAASVITCTAHAYSAATDSVDVANFATDDAIETVERDPDDPAAPDVFTTVVDTVTTGANTISTDDAWAAYDSNKEYYLISDDYSSAASTQASDAYYADTDDGRVADSRSPYTYAEAPLGQFTSLVGTELAERHSNRMFADGIPVATGAAWALAQNVNNLANYATAPHGPFMFQATQNVTSTDYLLIAQWPIHLGPVEYPAGLIRKVSCAPLMLTSNASYKMYVRVTLSRWRCSGTSATDVTFTPPYSQLEFETNSTTYVTPTVQTFAPTSPLVYQLGDGWITIEAKVESGHVGSGDVYGLSKFWLGPLESL